MADIIGLHDRSAERIARREMPHLHEAKAILERYTDAQIKEMAWRGFRDPGSLSTDEVAALIARARVRFSGAEAS